MHVREEHNIRAPRITCCGHEMKIAFGTVFNFLSAGLLMTSASLLYTGESQQFTDYAKSLRCISGELKLRGKQRAYDDNMNAVSKLCHFLSLRCI